MMCEHMQYAQVVLYGFTALRSVLGFKLVPDCLLSITGPQTLYKYCLSFALLHLLFYQLIHAVISLHP